jgi:arylsulfatase A-like enzyme
VILVACAPREAPPTLPESACGEPSTEVGVPAIQFASANPHNLLVLTIDTLRRDRVGRYAGDDTTPFLDDLLASSVTLDDFRACANWTLPGMVCSVTGQSTLDLGLDPLAPDTSSDTDTLDPDLETLATWLAAEGFDTTLVTSSSLFSARRAVGNGFAEVKYDNDAPAARLVDTALASARGTTTERPWYLHVHFRDPHGPYDPPAAYQGLLAAFDLDPDDPRTEGGLSSIATAPRRLGPLGLAFVRQTVDQLYRGELRYLDTELARLWEALLDEGYLDDTLAVVWSDHGEQNFEHDDFQHAQSLHAEEGMAVAAFWSAGIEPVAVDAPTSQPDLVPTVLDALGIAIPAGVTGAVVGTAPSDRVRFSTAVDDDGNPVHSVERNGHRLLYNWSGTRSYYAYPLDPEERDDLYDSDDEDVRCLWDFLRPAIERVDAERAGMEPDNPE